MSALRTIDIACDALEANGAPCPQWTAGVSGSRLRIADARKLAGASGWTTGHDHHGVTDYCPDHSHAGGR